jgi:ring-1,2-phenylacetyl-CoA epoxidase subunit PaaE
LGQLRKYTLAVIEKVVETEDACTLKFKQPGLKKISYIPGQFITLILNINGRIYQRPYSISSVYKIDATIDITVKAIKDGKVSNYIKNNLEVGQSVEIVEPLGSFILPESIPEKVVLWAAGSGISPLFAILKALINNSNANIILNYSSRNLEQTILLAGIEKLKNQFPNRLHFNLFTSNNEGPPNATFERYNRLNVQHILALNTKNKFSVGTLHYICGPNDYNVLVQRCLKELNCDSDCIKVEDFNQVLDENDLIGVFDTNIQIKLGEIEHRVLVRKGNSILAACLDNDINIDYSCQTGTCELCMGHIVSGQVNMIVHHKKETKSKGDSCLLCCSYPLTNDILISVN